MKKENKIGDITYWMEYYVNEFTTPNEIIAHFNLEEGIQKGIGDWNDECELGNEVRTQQEIEIIRNVANGFFIQTGWISSSIIQAMIVQSF
jgi:hypothetical protein